MSLTKTCASRWMMFRACVFQKPFWFGVSDLFLKFVRVHPDRPNFGKNFRGLVGYTCMNDSQCVGCFGISVSVVLSHDLWFHWQRVLGRCKTFWSRVAFWDLIGSVRRCDPDEAFTRKSFTQSLIFLDDGVETNNRVWTSKTLFESVLCRYGLGRLHKRFGCEIII